MSTLNELVPGQTGQIVDVEGADGIASRLREMGFIKGAVVKAMPRAPFGGPLKCLIQNCRVALRSTEARRIMIQQDS